MKDRTVNPDGTIDFPSIEQGAPAMTWVPAKHPDWKEFCRISHAADPKNRHYPMESKWVRGLGSYFRTVFVEGLRR